MLHHRSVRPLRHSFVVLLLLAAQNLIGLTGCAGSAAPVETPDEAMGPNDLIARALEDAEQADEDEVVTDLITLTPEQPGLQWQTDEAGEAWVQLVTWTDWDGYRAQVGQTVPLGGTRWFTVPPEVQTMCRATGLSGDALRERLEQYLGIRPGEGKPYFVTLWVRPSTVVRPCADPNVGAASCAATDVATDVQIGTHAHRAWFDGLRAESYGANGYPWTRLGYTYDWAPGANHRGATEFVIPDQTSVKIEAFTTTDEYCR